MSGKIATPADMVVMREAGIETGVIVIEACQGEMLDATMMRDQGEIGIFLKGATIVAGNLHGLQEAIVMSSQCR